MKVRELSRWNARVAAVYALGVWTMLGSYGYLSYTGQLGDYPEPIKVEEEEKENPNIEVYRNEYVTAVVTRKENFVPYTTRIYTYLTSLMDESKSKK